MEMQPNQPINNAPEPEKQSVIEQPVAPSASQKNTGMAALAYILFFVPLLTDAKNDPFVKFHTKQGLVLFLTGAIVALISWVPIAGWLLAALFPFAAVIFMIIGIINAINGKQEKLPLIGRYADYFNF